MTPLAAEWKRWLVRAKCESTPPARPGDKFQIKRIIWYSMNMANETIRNEACEPVQEVNNFLNKIGFTRTFPLNLVVLAEKMGDFKIYYFSESLPDKDKLWGIISPSEHRILINPIFRKDLQSFLTGRYLLAKLVARFALGDVPEKMAWSEFRPELRPDQDWETNERTAAFAFELLMPAEEFRRQWQLLGKNEIKLSEYFGVTQRKVIERAMFLGEYHACNKD